MMTIRSAQLPGTGAALGGAPEVMRNTDPLQAQAAQAFAVELAAGRVPSGRAIRVRCMWGSHVPSGYAHTWPRSTARRRAYPSNSPLPSPGFRRLPDRTARRLREISAVRRAFRSDSESLATAR
jgi:hypothetical protein